MTTVLDTPAQISNWVVLSAISQLSLELSSGTNFYGKTSAYVGVRRNLIADLPPRATKRNKLLALATILNALPEETGPVFARGRKVLAEVMESEGLVFTQG